jgi:hypothetical protein
MSRKRPETPACVFDAINVAQHRSHEEWHYTPFFFFCSAVKFRPSLSQT